VERKWEYKTITFNKRKFFTSQIDWEEFNALLNRYGGNGWEIISSIPTGSPFFTGSVTVILKRGKFESHA